MREHVHVERNAVLKLSQLEQRFHQQFWIDCAVLWFQNDADIFGRLIANIIEQRQLLCQKQLRNLLDQARFLHLIWDLGYNDNPGSAIPLFLLPTRTCAERTTPCAIGFDNVGMVFNQNAAGREIRAAHFALEKCSRVALRFLLQLFPLFWGSDEFFHRRIRMIDEIKSRRAKFSYVMRWNIGGHANRDTGRSVGKKIRESTRKNDRFLVFFVIGRAEVDSVFGNALKQQRCHFSHTRFGITHRGGVIAIDIAEIALSVHERIAHCKILSKTHQRIIDRSIAVRVELAHHVADNTCTFCVSLIGIEP